MSAAQEAETADLFLHGARLANLGRELAAYCASQPTVIGDDN